MLYSTRTRAVIYFSLTLAVLALVLLALGCWLLIPAGRSPLVMLTRLLWVGSVRVFVSLWLAQLIPTCVLASQHAAGEGTLSMTIPTYPLHVREH